MDRPTDYAREILDMEAQFAQMAADSGVESAFLYFVADDGVIVRGNKTYQGKAAIKGYFNDQKLKNVKLSWKPDHVDVSESGDMAYTFGKYKFEAESPEGEPISAEGIFHTVWKRQSDGNWKFVYD